MKRILILTALAAAVAATALAGPAIAGAPVLTDLTVNPNQGRPGDAFTVSGGGCLPPNNNIDQAAGRSGGGRFAPRRGDGHTVSVEVAFPAPTATVTAPNGAGDWSVGFVVPPGTPPGVYEVAASCLLNPIRSGAGAARGGIPIEYESSTYTVLADPAAPGAPAAAPVPGTPTFTG